MSILRSLLGLRNRILERDATGLFTCHAIGARDGKGELIEKSPKLNGRPSWLTVVLTPEEIQTGVREGDLFGIRPTAIGVLVVDVDHGDPSELIRLHPPLAQISSPRGGHGCHLIYREPLEGSGNRKWKAHGCSGEIRHDRGYICHLRSCRAAYCGTGGQN